MQSTVGSGQAAASRRNTRTPSAATATSRPTSTPSVQVTRTARYWSQRSTRSPNRARKISSPTWTSRTGASQVRPVGAALAASYLTGGATCYVTHRTQTNNIIIITFQCSGGRSSKLFLLTNFGNERAADLSPKDIRMYKASSKISSI